MILRQPDNIVHKILTHLDFSDLVRTSVLSKPWRYLWVTSSSNLIFNASPLEFKRNGVNREISLLFAEQTLGIRNSTSCLGLDKLVLPFVKISSLEEITRLDNCIRYAIACDVKRLHLSVRPISVAPSYRLPPTLFGHTGLVELYLSGCMLISSSVPCNMSLPCLKVLHISSSTFYSMKLVVDLIASCPLVEDFILMNFSGNYGVLKIDGIVDHPKLINVNIAQCSFKRIEIDAPGLQSFTFSHDIYSAPCEIVMSSCKSIRELRLQNVDNVPAFTNNWFGDISSRHLHLESLVLFNCSMETLKISSSILKRVKLISCDKLVKVELDDSNLSSFCYSGKNMIYFSSNALDLSVDIALFHIPSNVDTTWFIEFVEFLGRFNTAKALELNINSHKNVIVPRELRASLLPPLYNVEHLVLKIREDSLTHTIGELIDELLWLSPRPASISFASYGKKILVLTFLYDERDGEGKYCDCFSSLITCWRHCLKEVNIKNLGMDEDVVEKDVKSFFEHALSLRKCEDLQV